MNLGPGSGEKCVFSCQLSEPSKSAQSRVGFSVGSSVTQAERSLGSQGRIRTKRHTSYPSARAAQVARTKCLVTGGAEPSMQLCELYRDPRECSGQNSSPKWVESPFQKNIHQRQQHSDRQRFAILGWIATAQDKETKQPTQRSYCSPK